MNKSISVADKDNGALANATVSTVEELVELNIEHSIYSRSNFVYYGKPFDTQLVLSSNGGLNKNFPSLILVYPSQTNCIPKGELLKNKKLKLALEFQFELEDTSLFEKEEISSLLTLSNGIQYNLHPLGYSSNKDATEDAKGVLLFQLLVEKQYDLVDKYAELLENNYCSISDTKELMSCREALDALLNN